MTPTKWLLGNDTGTSSKTILSVMQGLEFKYHDVPYDAGDFGRCHRLLEIFPEWKSKLNEVSKKYKEWGPLVAAWDELTAMYLNDDKQMCKRMQELIEEGRLQAGWTKTGPGSWKGPNVNEITLRPGVTMRF